MGSTSDSVWLITGASQGLGLALTISALKAGHKVLAGARNPEKAAQEHPEVESAGGKWLKLDVNSPGTANIVADAIKEAGRIDVVINNAGYYLTGVLEDLKEEEMQAIMDTNFFGPTRVLRGVLPTMRSQNSGTIVLIGSIFAFSPCPAGAMYNCTKAAAEMLHDTLKMELTPFNIRTVIVEAGLYRTAILTNSQFASNGISEAYLNTPLGKIPGMVQSWIQDPQQHIAGDPEKFGDRVIDFIDGKGMATGLEKHTRLLIGRDAFELAGQRMKELTENFKACEKIALSTDFEGHTAPGVMAVTSI